MRLLIWLLLTLAVAAAPLTPERLLALPKVSEVRLSPDGRWVAVAVGPEVRVYPYRLGPLPRPAARYAEASGPRWSSSGRLLVLREGQAWGTDSAWKLTQLTRHPGGIEHPVWGPQGQVGFVGRVRVTGSQYEKGQDSGRLFDDLFMRRWNEVYDGKRQHLFVGGKDVTPGDFDAYPTSGTFSSGANFCFSADGSALLCAAPPRRGQASDTNYDVWRVDVASARRENLTSSNKAADLGPRLAQGRLYIVAHSRPGYESDFGVVKSVAVDRAGRPQGEWRVEEAVKDPSELVVSEDGFFYTTYENAAFQGYHDATALNLLGSLHSLSCDRAGRRWGAVQASLSQPPRVMLGEGRAAAFWDFAPKLTLGVVESTEVPVEGATMQMFIIKPPAFQAERKWPVAYLVHGGPQGGWSDDWSPRWNAQAWAAQGYVVVMPNPRGSSGQSHEFQEQVSRDWGGRAYRDLMTGADYTAALPYVDPERMLAAGASYGGYMVNWIAVHTARFKALVTHCGVWNLESMYGVTDELWFADWEFGGPPWKGSPDYAAFSPHKLADQLKTPHLVIHNDRDYRCPLDQGLQLFTALQLQGVPSRLLNFPDEGHHMSKPKNALRWYREVFAFVKRYCPPGGR